MKGASRWLEANAVPRAARSAAPAPAAAVLVRSVSCDLSLRSPVFVASAGGSERARRSALRYARRLGAETAGAVASARVTGQQGHRRCDAAARGSGSGDRRRRASSPGRARPASASAIFAHRQAHARRGRGRPCRSAAPIGLASTCFQRSSGRPLPGQRRCTRLLGRGGRRRARGPPRGRGARPAAARGHGAGATGGGGAAAAASGSRRCRPPGQRADEGRRQMSVHA